MNLNDWALLSQICAVLLGIPSLIYLALQIKQSTSQARANAHHQFLDINKDLNLTLMSNKQMASVYRRGLLDYGSLDEDEQIQFFFYIAQYFQTFSTMHALWKQRLLTEEAWHPIKKHLISMMSQPSMQHVWTSWGRPTLPPVFVAYVEALHASGEDTYALQEALAGTQAASISA